MSDLRAFFTPPRERAQPPPRRSASPLDARIQEALRRSREEARVAALSDDEALREALAASLAEAQPDPEELGGAAGGSKAERGTASGDWKDCGEASGRRTDDNKPGSAAGRRLSGGALDGGADSKRRRTEPAAQRTAVAETELKQESSSAKPAKPIAPLFARSSLPVPAPDLTSAVASTSQTPLEVIDRFDGSLDLLYCKGWLTPIARQALFAWMTAELRWHRVIYTRPGTGITIRTPRYTTTYGRDETGAPDVAYQQPPVAFPPCLDDLRRLVEAATGARFNTMICNLYADGNDSISYHSDDEAFLGPNCTIASLSLGAARDFFMRRKAPAGVDIAPARPDQKSGTKGSGPAAGRPTERWRLGDGDLLVMRGRTQSEWEHAVPKRASAGPRINITFRRVNCVAGVNNFMRYSRGDGPGYRWRGGRLVEAPGGQ